MSGLTLGPVRFSSNPPANDAPPLPVDAPPLPEFEGPDFTATPEKDPVPEKPRRGRPRKPVQDKEDPAAPTMKPLGQNKKLRSPVRKLNRVAPNGETKSDLERLADWYRRLGKMAAMFHPKFAMAMDAQADDCAESWFDLAENNDTVRRYILGMIEGGAWGKVIGAHVPIFMAVIPEETLNRFFLKGMGLFAKNTAVTEEQMAGVFDAMNGYEAR